ELIRRFSVLLHRNRYVDDLEAEMRLHREFRREKLERAGMKHAEAVSAAERQFGNTTLIREISADMWSWNWLDDLVKDVRHTGRMLAANSMFTLVTVLTLALGIGANTAIFSVTNAVLLRTMPARDPQRLFYVHVEPGQPDGAGNTGN